MTARHLLLDAGNTSLKYSFENQLAQPKVKVLYHGSYSLEQELHNLHQQSPIGQVSLASVYDANFSETVVNWCHHNRVKLLEAKTRDRLGDLINGYEMPVQLGIDRWLSMFAVWQKRKAAFFIVSCGTAVTFDAVNGKGQHLGGLIMPGLRVMRQSLVENTAMIQTAGVELLSTKPLAINTQDGIAAGTISAVTAFIEKLMAKTGFATNQGILTGGDALLVAENLETDLSVIPNLVLEGLSFYAKQVTLS